MGEASLQLRFSRSLRSLGVAERPRHLLIAFSGGLDSTVLLHLLRFRVPELPIRLTAAHLDHRMRDGSGGDAEWVRGLAAAWQVPLFSEAAGEEIRTESRARELRYTFLAEAARRAGADRIVTAHHADDQAETVLFRILRGTGLPGLGGIPRQTATGVIRPLLPFWREEIVAYAEEHGLRWREDPSNATWGPTRNRIRLHLLPQIEREISGAARRNLVALAALARESETGWRRVLSDVYPRVVTHVGEAVLVARPGLREYDPAIATRIVRKALRRFGIEPGNAGTRRVLQFITDAPSGREMQLPRGVRITSEFDVARIQAASEGIEDSALSISREAAGEPFEGEVRLGGHGWRIAMLPHGTREVFSGTPRWSIRLAVAPDQFPLTVRARAPGDRVRTLRGGKSLKKLMIEARVPLRERSSRPIVVDSLGSVLWIAGVETAPLPDETGDAIQVDLSVFDA